MNPEVLKNALYAAWCIAEALGHQWSSLGWVAIAEAARRTKSLRAAARKIADLTHKYTTPGPLGFGIDSPTVARGGRAFCHVTATGRSEFEVLPGSPEEPAAQVHQWIMRPNRALAVHGVWLIEVKRVEPLVCEVLPPARRRHLDALIFRVDTVNVDGVYYNSEDALALLREREKWDIIEAARALDKAVVDAGVIEKVRYREFVEHDTVELNIARLLADTE